MGRGIGNCTYRKAEYRPTCPLSDARCSSSTVFGRRVLFHPPATPLKNKTSAVVRVFVLLSFSPEASLRPRGERRAPPPPPSPLAERHGPCAVVRPPFRSSRRLVHPPSLRGALGFVFCVNEQQKARLYQLPLFSPCSVNQP